MYNFTTWERLALIQLLSGLKGNLGVIRTGSKLMDKLEITDEEREFIHSEGTILSWDKELPLEVELIDEEVNMLRTLVESSEGWELSNSDRILALSDKL